MRKEGGEAVCIKEVKALQEANTMGGAPGCASKEEGK